ncbi:FAD-dependent oxidoreductase [Acidithrix ferrooxidans]|uniref:Glutamate synthase [NADPH] small chain n=2 Tax=root TaxID=1 RepID=A0A0D8HHA9_9ACTN|nr:FAD-dependent oxidoreductase [Acidithrix ferrooxidans]KJF16446.1 glutamate synthase [NADPH] small chain [Acidithrix ferrooxidans]
MTTTFNPTKISKNHSEAPEVPTLGSELLIEVLTDRCAGCQECLIRCPTGAIGLDTDNWIVTVDSALCVGCGQCERTCPFSAITIDGTPKVAPSERHYLQNRAIPAIAPWEETRSGFSNLEAVLAEASRCLSCPDPTCVRGCPAHNDIPAMIASIREGNLDQARSIFEATTHLGSICSRVCNQAVQCEGACSWKLAGNEPVAIGLLERFVFDNSEIHAPHIEASSSMKVAVVGSGPAGMSAAWEFVEAGAEVTVYEADPIPGGLLNHGIPEFTLPSEKVSEVWKSLSDAGVKVELNHRVSQDDLQDFTEKLDAIVLANGASSPIRPSVQGLDRPNVIDAMAFLAAYGEKLGAHNDTNAIEGKKILVIGAGNTAMDVGRIAIRFGAIPTCVEWVTESFARVRSDELEEARHEGVSVRFNTTATLITDGKATLVTTQQSDPKVLPKLIPGTEEIVDADIVVLALGYRLGSEFGQLAPQAPFRASESTKPDDNWITSGIFSGNHNYNRSIADLSWKREVAVAAARSPYAANVFVVGDALVGPSSVVEAMASGREAARASIRAHASKK